MCVYEAREHWKQYKQKKYQQCPAEKPGGMILDEMKEAEELQAKLNDNSTKLVSDYDWKEFDEWMKSLIAKNGTTNY